MVGSVVLDCLIVEENQGGNEMNCRVPQIISRVKNSVKGGGHAF